MAAKTRKVEDKARLLDAKLITYVGRDLEAILAETEGLTPQEQLTALIQIRQVDAMTAIATFGMGIKKARVFGAES